MTTQPDLLTQVVAELERLKGDLARVARESGVPYDTVLRLKNRENDPGFSLVKRMHEHLFGAKTDETT